MDKLHWSVDSLILRNNTFFGFGWIFHEEMEIQDVRLALQFDDGETQTIAADFGKLREDVGQHFPAFPTAMHSGYLFFGSARHAAGAIQRFFLQGMYADGSAFELDVPAASVMCLDQPGGAPDRVRVRQLGMLFKRGWHLLANGQLSSLYEKACRYVRGRPKAFMADADDLRKRLRAHERDGSVLVIDHDLGGGANHYRERLVAEKIDSGATVFILSFHVATLSYVMMIRNKRLNERFAIPGYDFLVELAQRMDLKEIIYNTGVSFARPEDIPQLIVKLKSQFNPRLTLLVHDFFMVCPSHFLLDSNGVFCGIPSLEKCKSCLPKNRQGFVTLFQAQDMGQWRALWGNVIGLADEVRTFSNDTLRLLQSAYPQLSASRALVVPHKVEYMRAEAIRPSQTGKLKIGVVGQIGFHKGAKVIQELSREIDRRGLDIQIVVIGAIEAPCVKSVVRQTGTYQHEQLPALLKSSEVNVMLFSSICPETFSYVVQELIAFDLPVACFNLGAPAERLSNYAKGLVLKQQNVPAVLDELIAFHQQIYLTN